MIITCLSDLHGAEPELPGGDLLIIAGDLTSNDTPKAWVSFYKWFLSQEYKKKVYVGGNHDVFLESCCNSTEASDLGLPEEALQQGFEYLCDSGTEFEGVKIWGSPWVNWFKGMHPSVAAFTKRTEAELLEPFRLIPEDTDILVTHSPPLGIMDMCYDAYSGKIKCVGSQALRSEIENRIKPKLHVFGHIHEGYGEMRLKNRFHQDTICVNASIMDKSYKAVNKPITLEINFDKRDQELLRQEKERYFAAF